VVVAATLFVVTVKVPVVAPAGTTTLAGTVAVAVLLLVRLIRAPPAGAADVNVTVPVEVAADVTVVGFRLREARAAGRGPDEIFAIKASYPPVHRQ
jgi:hypothetical protein